MSGASRRAGPLVGVALGLGPARLRATHEQVALFDAPSCHRARRRARARPGGLGLGVGRGRRAVRVRRARIPAATYAQGREPHGGAVGGVGGRVISTRLMLRTRGRSGRRTSARSSTPRGRRYGGGYRARPAVARVDVDVEVTARRRAAIRARHDTGEVAPRQLVWITVTPTSRRVAVGRRLAKRAMPIWTTARIERPRPVAGPANRC